MPSIRSRDIACAEGPDIRSLEHLLKLLDVVNNAFNIHSEQYSEPASQPTKEWASSLNCQPQQEKLYLGKTLGKTVVIEPAGHKIPQNAGLRLAVDCPGF